jgi:hypothetical protein
MKKWVVEDDILFVGYGTEKCKERGFFSWRTKGR